MAQAKIEIFVIADAAQAEAVLAKLAVQTETTGLASERSGTKVGGLLERLRGIGPAGAVGAVGIEEVTGKLASGLGPASGSAAAGIEKLDASLGSMGSGMLAAGAAVGASVIAMGALVEIVKKSVEAATAYNEQVKRVKDLTGGTAEESSKLVNRFKAFGLSVEDVQRSVGALGIAINKGEFKKYGIEVAYAKDGTVDYIASLENARTAISEETDATKANAEAKALLARGYITMSQYLHLNSEEYAKVSQRAAEQTTSSERNLQATEQLKIAQNELSTSINLLWVGIGNDLIPRLVDMTQGLLSVVDTVDSAAKHVGGLGNVLQFLVTVIPGPTQLMGMFADALGIVGANADKSAEGMTRSATAAKIMASNFAEASKDVNALIQDDIAAREATLALQQVQAEWAKKQADDAAAAAQAVKDATQTEADAETNLAQTRIDTGQQVADADQRVADAQVSAASRVETAKQRVADLNRKLAQDSAQDLTRGRGVEDAQKNLARVQMDIASGKLKGTDATRAYQDAEEQLARAQQDRLTADKRQADTVAQDQVEIARAKAAERAAEISGAEEVREARDNAARARVDAERRVTAAIHQVTTAHAALVAAQHRTTTSAADLARHELAVEQAVLRNRAAYQKLAGDLTTVTGLVNNHKLSWDQVHAIISQISGTDLPVLAAHLNNLFPNGPSAAPAAVASPFIGAHATGSAQAGTVVNVSINGLVADAQTAERMGRQVADGVWRALLAKQAGGTNLGLNGRG